MITTMTKAEMLKKKLDEVDTHEVTLETVEAAGMTFIKYTEETKELFDLTLEAIKDEETFDHIRKSGIDIVAGNNAGYIGTEQGIIAVVL